MKKKTSGREVRRHPATRKTTTIGQVIDVYLIFSDFFFSSFFLGQHQGQSSACDLGLANYRGDVDPLQGPAASLFFTKKTETHKN
jgi:hypothetical protein